MASKSYRFEISFSYNNGATLSSIFFHSSSDLSTALTTSISSHLEKYPYPFDIERLQVDISEV